MMIGSATDSPPVFRTPPPKRTTPPWGGGAEAGRTGNRGGLPTGIYSGLQPMASEASVTGAVRLVKHARNTLLLATYVLDDAGYECPALNDCYADVAGLVAEWAGRPSRAQPRPFPDWIAASAREWRRQNGRSY